MEDETIQILCTGDLHLGRHPTRIPEPLDGPNCSPRSVWQDIVRDAIDRGVDVVVLTGDVADRENRYFEAYGALEAGVVELDNAGIPVITVAGNHDSEFLPRMVDDIDLDNLHLLGENGTWERWTLKKNGDTAAHFDGWSFPDQHVSTSPLVGYDLEVDDNTPQIGVLHGELDSQGSRYAPVRSSELRDTPVACWLLGHIHTPGIKIESDPTTLYPGSPQALDPGEQGIHGPWLISIDSDNTVTTEQIPMGTACYDSIQVDVSDAEDPQAVVAAVSGAIQQYAEAQFDMGNIGMFLPRIRLTGRTPAHAQIVDQQSTLQEQLATKHKSVDVRIESISVDTRPAVDLDELADADGPVSYLADLLLALDDGDLNEEYNRLIDDAQETMHDAQSAGAYNLLRREADVDSPQREDAIETVKKEAQVLLDTLLQQKEGKL